MKDEQPSPTLQKTLALFDAPGEDERDVEWLVSFLGARVAWTTAAECLAAVGQPATEDWKRWVRGLADRSDGRVIGFSKGYKLTEHLTVDEYKHWRATTMKSVSSIRERVLKTDLKRSEGGR